MTIQCALYERAIAEADKQRFAGEAHVEEALRSFWLGYVNYLVGVMQIQLRNCSDVLLASEKCRRGATNEGLQASGKERT